MNNILEEIAEKTRERVREQKQKVSLEEIKKLAYETREINKNKKESLDFALENALRKPGLSFICEVKKASPSKGLIASDFPYVEIAREYEKGGASAISVLTEPYYFQGSNQYLKEIKENVSIPILRKDFTVDEYMIYEAKVIGADGILLICSLLDNKSLASYLKLAKDLGLSVLVEAHDKEEVMDALAAGATLIGVNNRDLKNFTVDINNSLRLRKLVPKEIIFLSESGIRTLEDIKNLADNQVDGVLIGETLMRSKNRIASLEQMRQAGLPDETAR